MVLILCLVLDHVVVNLRSVQVSLIIFVIESENGLLARSPLNIRRAPAVLRAVRLAKTLKPGIERLVVTHNGVIGFRCELVRIKVLNDPSLPSCTDGLLACLSSCEYLHVHHIVLLLPHLLIIVNSAQKY